MAHASRTRTSDTAPTPHASDLAAALIASASPASASPASASPASAPGLVQTEVETQPVETEEECELRLLAEVPALVWRAAPNGGRDYFNQTWLLFTGRAAEQEQGEGWLEGVHPADRAHCLRTLREAFAARREFEIEYRLRRHDGEYRAMLDRARPFARRANASRDDAASAASDADGGGFDESDFGGFIGSCFDVSESQQARRELERQETMLAQAQALAHLGSWTWNLQTNLVLWSDELCRIHGLDPLDLARRPATPQDALSFIHPDDQENVRLRTRDCLQNGQSFELHYRVLLADGTMRVLHAHGAVERDEAGTPLRMFGTGMDVTERRQAEEALRRSEERYALAARGANEGLWDWDLERGAVHYSPRWQEMLGYPDGALGQNIDEWLGRVHADDIDALRHAITEHLAARTPHFEQQHRLQHKDGAYRWMRARGLAVRDENGKATRMAGSLADLTEQRGVEEKLLHSTLHDALTGLPNRVLFMDRLMRAMERVKRHENYLLAVLFLDFDHFKVINDSLGHLVGDGLLQGVAVRLHECLRGADTVARLGGDEFVILLDDIKDAGDAVDAAKRIQSRMKPEFMLQGHRVFTDASIGIALSRLPSGKVYDSPEEIVRDADTAMYRAKNLGRGRYEIFDTQMHARAMQRLQSETELRRAIENEEFMLCYQPIIGLQSGEINGFETLVRWRHPQRGTLAPGEFMALAEETGLIVPLDRWVLRQACAQGRKWQELQGLRERADLSVSVNLSRRHFSRHDVVSQIEDVLRETGLSAASLRLEISESVLTENRDSIAETLARLRDLGVRLSMDNFGTGYSPLAFLHRFPIHALKIDRSFISRLHGSHETNGAESNGSNGNGSHKNESGATEKSGANEHGNGHNQNLNRSGRGEHDIEIVRSIVALARSLRVDVVAGGVETREQMAQLRSLQCGYGQGHFFAQPVASDEAALMLEAHRQW